MPDPNPPTLRPRDGAPDHYSPDAPLPLVATSRAFVQRATWTYAATMPWARHWYTLRRSAARTGDYDALRQLIREHHYVRRWKSRAFRAVNLGGLTLWIMEDDPGTSNGGTVLINAIPAEPVAPVLSLFE